MNFVVYLSLTAFRFHQCIEVARYQLMTYTIRQMASFPECTSENDAQRFNIIIYYEVCYFPILNHQCVMMMKRMKEEWVV